MSFLPNMLRKKNLLIFLALIGAWFAFSAWQYHEHVRFMDRMKDWRLSRAQDISSSFSAIIRSMARFGVVQKNSLEAALGELVKMADVRALNLMDPAGNVVVTAGDELRIPREALSHSVEKWNDNSLLVINLVELGTQVNARTTTETLRFRPGPVPPEERSRDGRPPRDDRFRESRDGQRMVDPASGPASRPRTTTLADSVSTGGTTFRRPSWMNEENYRQVIRLHGPHYLAMMISTRSIAHARSQDGWRRFSLVLITLIASIGLGAAWFGATRSIELQVRLARAQETNTMLREMNLAAAGLAHETRNPLNLVRGMAQIISKDTPSNEIRVRAQQIVEEVDRVASRLNEFMDYSKPRQANLAATGLHAIIRDVMNALQTDSEDKNVRLHIEGPDAAVKADENLLRQVIFNLLLNALQAVSDGGEVTVAVVPHGNQEIVLEVRDNGPGVPEDSQEEIFRPYFTTRPDGTGLGLAIVRQFVVAHQWDIHYEKNKDGLSVFRISGVKLA